MYLQWDTYFHCSFISINHAKIVRYSILAHCSSRVGCQKLDKLIYAHSIPLKEKVTDFSVRAKVLTICNTVHQFTTEIITPHRRTEVTKMSKHFQGDWRRKNITLFHGKTIFCCASHQRNGICPALKSKWMLFLQFYRSQKVQACDQVKPCPPERYLLHIVRPLEDDTRQAHSIANKYLTLKSIPGVS